jgi:hypothetical protein
MVNNCGIVQMFGTKNFQVAAQLADLIGVEFDEVRGLAAQEQIVVIDGIASKCVKPDYLVDRRFRDLFDDNPYHANTRRP